MPDRTLYEPSAIRLDREPNCPTLVSAPDALAEAAKAGKLTGQQAQAGGGGDEEGRGLGGKIQERGGGRMDDESDTEEEEEEEEEAAAAAAAGQKAAGKEAGKTLSGVTLSGLPRSYWETLFHLDLVRARNKPAAPVAQPAQAPFFLPTLRGADGLQPTFGDLEGAESSQGGALEPGTSTFAAVAAFSSTKRPEAGAGGEEGSGAGVGEPKGWGDAWSDDDAEGEARGGGKNPWDSGEEKDDAAAQAAAAAAATGAGDGGSRLLRRSRPLELSRGKLAALLGTHAAALRLQTSRRVSKAHCAGGESGESAGAEAGRRRAAGASVMGLLKSLTPSAVDVELESLCRVVDSSGIAGGGNSAAEEGDPEGLELLGLFLAAVAAMIGTGEDFDAAQACLHRFLKIHAEVMSRFASLLNSLSLFPLPCFLHSSLTLWFFFYSISIFLFTSCV